MNNPRQLALVLWNTVYLEQASNALHGRGLPRGNALLQYLSPLGWEHINQPGRRLPVAQYRQGRCRQVQAGAITAPKDRERSC